MFGPDQLHAAVRQALEAEQVPEKARGAFVLVATTGGGVSGVLSAKVNNTWTVSGVFHVEHDGAIAGGIAVKAVW